MPVPSCSWPGCTNAQSFIRSDNHLVCLEHRHQPWPEATKAALVPINDIRQALVNLPTNRALRPPGAIGGLRAASRPRTAQNATRARKLRASRKRAKYRRHQRQQIEILQGQLESSQDLLYHLTTDMQRDARARDRRRSHRRQIIIRTVAIAGWMGAMVWAILYLAPRVGF